MSNSTSVKNLHQLQLGLKEPSESQKSAVVGVFGESTPPLLTGGGQGPVKGQKSGENQNPETIQGPVVSQKSGVDWLEGDVFGVVEDKRPFSRVWDVRREKAQKGGLGEWFKIGRRMFKYLTKASSKGSQELTHVAMSHDETIFISVADVSEYHDPEKPLAFVQFKGRFFLGKNEAAAIEEIESFLGELGIHEPQMRIKRCDLRCDLYGVEMRHFEKMEVVTDKLKRGPVYGLDDQLETINFKKGKRTVICMYDKVREISQSDKKFMEYVEANPHYNGGPITRVEIRFDSEDLERVVVKTLQELKERMSVMISQTIRHKVRFVIADSATRKKRCTPSKVWAEMGQTWSRQVAEWHKEATEVGEKMVDNEVLWNVAIGALTSIGGNNGWDFQELQDNLFVETNKREGKVKRLLAKKSAIRTGMLETSTLTFVEAEDDSQDAMKFLREQLLITEKLRAETWPKSLDEAMQTPLEVYDSYFETGEN